MAKKIDVDKYVAGLFRRTEHYAENVRKYYAYAVEELLKISANQSLEMGDLFSFKDNKRINEKATIILRQLYSAVYGEIKRGVSAEWEYANLSADALIQSIFGKGIIKDNHFAHWFGRNQKAMDAFFARAQGNGGLNLSQKVWKYTGNLREEMELALSLSLGEGGSASSISRRVRQYLQEPDKLFRRIKIGVDANGEPLYKLSKKASEYHPGQGVYRSSYKNAMRLTRTETNMAYRSADYERWQQLPFVVGIEINLSNNHNCIGVPKGRFNDICDDLKGVYPKDFKFVGWHPQCRCFSTPKLASVEEMMEYQEKVLNDEDVSNYHFKGEVRNMPKNFSDWWEDNQKGIMSSSSLPYWVRDNKKALEDIKSTSQKPKKPKKQIQTKHLEVDFDISPNEQLQKTIELTGVDAKIAKDFNMAVENFTYQYDYEIRAYQTGKSFKSKYGHTLEGIIEVEKNLEKFIEKSPMFQGVTYRGIAVTAKVGKSIIEKLQKGETIDMLGTSSWSTKINVAESFKECASKDLKRAGNKSDEVIEILFVCDKQSKGTSIRHLSQYMDEDEVIVSKSAKYKGLPTEVEHNKYIITLFDIEDTD